MGMGLARIMDGAERSERSERRDSPSGGAVEVLAAVTPGRRHTAEYKLKVLEEMDRCREPGQRAAIARREGLYSPTIKKWKEWREQMRCQQKTGKSLPEQLRELERENERLRLKLKKAEGLVELQKKAFALLESMNRNSESI